MKNFSILIVLILLLSSCNKQNNLLENDLRINIYEEKFEEVSVETDEGVVTIIKGLKAFVVTESSLIERDVEIITNTELETISIIIKKEK